MLPDSTPPFHFQPLLKIICGVWSGTVSLNYIVLAWTKGCHFFKVESIAVGGDPHNNISASHTPTLIWVSKSYSQLAFQKKIPPELAPLDIENFSPSFKGPALLPRRIVFL